MEILLKITFLLLCLYIVVRLLTHLLIEYLVERFSKERKYWRVALRCGDSFELVSVPRGLAKGYTKRDWQEIGPIIASYVSDTHLRELCSGYKPRTLFRHGLNFSTIEPRLMIIAWS